MSLHKPADDASHQQEQHNKQTSTTTPIQSNKTQTGSSLSALKHFVTVDTNTSHHFAKLLSKDTTYLDYTFLSHRMLISNINNNKPYMHNNTQQQQQPFHAHTSTNNYIYDLNETLDINLNLLKHTITTSSKLSAKEKELLLTHYNAFISSLNKNKQIKHSLTMKISKLLIEKQILEELKRKIAENNEYYKEQLKESEDAVDTKNDYIKIFEKKLFEVEIYVQKHAKNVVDPRYEKYKNWKMNKFLNENNELCKTKDTYIKDNAKLREVIQEMKSDNCLYEEEIKKEQTEYENTNTHHNEEINNKVKAYIKVYKRNILLMKMKIKVLRSSLDKLTNTLQYLNVNMNVEGKKGGCEGKTKKEECNNNMNVNNNNNNNNNPGDTVINEKSLLPLDLTRKLNNFMDFSNILNKKQIEESKFEELGKTGIGNVLCNVTNSNMWDISCINKHEH